MNLLKQLWYYACMDARTSLHNIAQAFTILCLLVVLLCILCVPGCLAIWSMRALQHHFAQPACTTSTDCARLDTWSGRQYQLCPHQSMEAYLL